MNTPESFEDVKTAVIKALLFYANTVQSYSFEDLGDREVRLKLLDCYNKSLTANTNYRIFVHKAFHNAHKKNINDLEID